MDRLRLEKENLMKDKEEKLETAKAEVCFTSYFVCLLKHFGDRI